MNLPHLVLLPLLVVGAGGAVLWVAALVSVLRTTTAGRALVWVVLTLVFPVLGPVVWFAVGRRLERATTAPQVDQSSHVLAH